MIKLTNSCHGTSYNSSRSREELMEIHRKIYQGESVSAADRKALYRVKKALCGVNGCTCGDDLGERRS